MMEGIVYIMLAAVLSVIGLFSIALAVGALRDGIRDARELRRLRGDGK